MTMKSSFFALIAALSLPSMSFAQTSDTSCYYLGQILGGELPATLTDQRARLTEVVSTNDPAACTVELSTVRGQWKQLVS